MSGAYTPRALRGWLLHDDRITLDNLAANDGSATGSDYSQTGPGPGQAEPYDELGTFRPQAHHGQANDLDVYTVRAGIPGTDTGAGIAYREDGEAETSLRGWNEPNLVTGYRPVEWKSNASSWLNIAAVTCPRSQKVVVVGYDTGGVEEISVWVYDPTTRDWSARADLDPGVAVGPKIALLVLRDNGRLLLYEGDTWANVYYSDDDGTTWADYGKTPIVLDTNATKWRAVQDLGGVVLLLAVDEATGDYWQYASLDGLTFSEVTSGTTWGTHPSLCLTPSGSIVITFRNLTADASWIVLTDAYDRISTKTPSLIGGTIDTTTLESCCDADGIIYAFHSMATSDIVKVSRSLDEGRTFELYSFELLATGGSIASPTTHQHRVRFVAPSGGELVALFNSVHTGTSPSTDGSLVSLICGGWDTLEMGPESGSRRDRWAWGDDADQDLNGIFLPTETLENQGWVHLGGATTLVSGYHRYDTAAATINDNLTFVGHAPAAIVLVELRVVSGGVLTADDVIFRVIRRTGAVQTSLTLRLADTGFRVRDDSGAGSTLADVTLGMGIITQFLIQSYGDGPASVWYRRRDSSIWILAWQGTLGTDATGLSTDNLFVGNTATTADLRVGLIAWSELGALGINSRPNVGLTGSNFAPPLAWGKATLAPYPVRDQVDEDGRVLHLGAAGGVARYQERWDLPATYDYGIRETDPVISPKPTRTWRSTDLTEQILTWDLGDNSRLGHSYALGLALIRPNFRRAILEVSTSAAPSTFVQIGEYNSRVVVSSTFTRSGNLLEPGAAATPGQLYFGAEDLRRGFVTLDPSGTPVNCKIRHNSGGGWLAQGMRTALELTGVDGTEPTSGNLHVNIAGGVLVIHQSAPTAYRRVRLRIPVQECPDDYYELGGIVLGSIWAVGRQWSRGWSWRYEPLIREEEDDAGTIYVEPRAEEANTYRRALTVAWQDGYGAVGIRQGNPNYLAAGQGMPGLVADMDVWHQLVGLLRASRGGSIPSVALLEIPQVTGMVLDPTLWSYGRLGVGQSAQFNNVQGREGRSEVYRGESLTHTELVG